MLTIWTQKKYSNHITHKNPININVIAEKTHKHTQKILIEGRKSKIVDSIKLKVIAKMEDVTVKIENDIREIAALEVS